MDELEELLNDKRAIRRALIQVLPENLVEYLMELIVRDGAHRRLQCMLADVAPPEPARDNEESEAVDK